MGLLDKFLDAMKLNDDYDDDEEFLDDEDDDAGDDYKEEKPKKRFFQKFKEEDDLGDEDDLDDEDDLSDRESAPVNPFRRKEQKSAAARPEKNEQRTERSIPHTKEKPAKRGKITPMRKKGTGMEVNVIRPVSMEDTREIADTLLDNCTVVLNLEGLDVDIAQRIIDFTCGACYSLDGSLQKISSYIFILTPENVDISGDFQSILNGAFNELPSMKTQY
jgi:cell division inhibitor SepF